MSAYNLELMLSHNRGKKKSKKGLKIFLGVIIAIVIILGVLFAVNYKTIMLSTGNGTAKMNSVQDIKKSLTNSGLFKNVTKSVDVSGKITLIGKSKDNAISYTVTQQKSGKETVNAKINLKKLKVKGINKKAIFSGNFSSIQKLKAQADQYIEPIVGKDQALGIEAYLAKDILNQSKTKTNKIYVNHSFGNVAIQVTANLLTDKATVLISK